MKRYLVPTLLAIGALFAAGNAIGFLFTDAIGGSGFKANLLARPWLGITHTMGGATALLCGTVQIISAHLPVPRWHRAIGRLYVASLLASAITSFAFLPGASGWASGSGFAALASLWIATTLFAVYCALRGRLRAHAEWMRVSYALTFSAVTLRIELGLMVLGGIPFEIAFAIAAWTCWPINLLVLRASRAHVQAASRAVA